jgi:hypothetical protein
MSTRWSESLALIALCAVPVAAQVDTSLFYLAVHRQTDAVSVPGVTSATFRAEVHDSNAFTLSAVLDTPAPSNHTLASEGPTVFAYSGYAATDASLLALFPAGNYTFSLDIGEVEPLVGVQVNPFPSGAFPAEVPAVTPATYQALQGMDASQPFAFEFAGFNPGPDSSFGALFIDPVGGGASFSASFQPGDNAVAIPPSALSPGTVYTASLYFAHGIGDPIGAFGSGAFLSFQRLTFIEFFTRTPCDPDLNQDGNVDQADVDYLIDVIAGGPNPGGIDPDFNHDGNADQADVDALINVVAGGACP